MKPVQYSSTLVKYYNNHKSLYCKIQAGMRHFVEGEVALSIVCLLLYEAAKLGNYDFSIFLYWLQLFAYLRPNSVSNRTACTRVLLQHFPTFSTLLAWPRWDACKNGVELHGCSMTYGTTCQWFNPVVKKRCNRARYSATCTVANLHKELQHSI